jgi:hypothetical protein
MKQSERRRFLLAMIFSVLSHVTAFVLLLPLLAAFELVKGLVRDKNEALKVALLLAILIHLALILPLVQGIITLQKNSETEDRVTVDLWREADQDETPEKTPEEELATYKPKAEIPDGQVIRAPDTPDNRPPDEARFLSERDNRVEEERASSIRIPGVSKAAPSPEIKGSAESGQAAPGGMRVEEPVVGPPPPPDLKKTETGTLDDTKPGDPAVADINLSPNQAVMASALAGTGLDHLEGVIEGDNTQVNTKGWEFASFFNRVKQQVERYWHPDKEYQKRDPYATVYGYRDRETVLLVVLRGDGSLKKAYVMEQSGVPFLDDEAREAVEQGAPFPNVPDGLKDQDDGLVKFTFHFLVQVGSQPIIRMRRY